jgi:hypothetical protein
MCLVEYQNCRTVVPKELGKGVFATTDTKLVADKYFHSKESIIAFQGVTRSDFFVVDMKTLKVARWSGMVFKSSGAMPRLRQWNSLSSHFRALGLCVEFEVHHHLMLFGETRRNSYN